MLEDRWAAVAPGVQIHYLDRAQGCEPQRTPVLYVHGAIGAAEDFAGLLTRHGGRRAMAMSMRGMGRSDTPASGYAFNDKVQDILAVLRASGLRRLALFGFSVAVPCTIVAALTAPQVGALILGDYRPVYPRFDSRWLEATAQVPPGRVREVARRSMAEETAASVDLWDRLPEVRCPVLVLRGAAPGSLLSHEDAERYRMVLRRCEIAVLARAGHVLWQPDPEPLIRAVETFLAGVDGELASSRSGA
jgi:pimeloyl-ACP methyl ester carboxylesterase